MRATLFALTRAAASTWNAFRDDFKGGNMSSEQAPGMQGIDLKILKRILKLMDDAQLVELDMETEGVKVRLKRGGLQDLPVAPAVPPAVSPVTPVPPGLQTGAAVAATPARAEVPPTTFVVKSPMVGTFYRSPAPQAPPFVNAGDVVTEGQTLCLIEAMKLMNEIKAEKAGRITRALLENGQSVEYDQPMFEMEPA
jgi:oxaloacetate decarboxylase alpha subunit